MAVAVTMPQMGESMVEGTVARWLKAPGDAVTKLEALVEINTDKIDTEIPAPAAGTLLEVLVEAGQTVNTGTVLGYIGTKEEHAVVESATLITPATAVAPALSVAASAQVSAPSSQPARSDLRPTGRDYISPVVARMATEHQLTLDAIAGSGLHGRITKRDVLAHLATVEQAAPVSDPRVEEAGTIQPNQVVAHNVATTENEIWQPLSTMRRAIAEHMVQSKQNSPHVTTVFEVDMTAVVRHREQHKDAYAQRGVRLTYTPYFVAAVAEALRVVPEVNARFHSGDDSSRYKNGGEKSNGQSAQKDASSQSAIVLQTRVHIGVAVALEQGLIVPVLRDADERNLQGLARTVHDLAQQARTGQLSPDATRGGTFTITNHGVTGSLLGTPIINQPQAGILGIGAIVKRPVVRSSSPSSPVSLLPSADDAIVIRPMCYLSFSFDHRILDGARADMFVAHVVKKLQEWSPEAN
jgi:2-oxoisovalerate dehydrogenase E2 component (dihydrolipoyl transacylase)